MQIDIHELYGQFLVGICAIGLICCGISFALHAGGRVLHEVYSKWLKLDGVGRIVAAAFVCLMWLYGSTKQVKVAEAGADEGINLAEILYEVTTNGPSTAVDVKFIGTGVTTSTPVSVRMTQTNEWTTLSKVNPTITVDLPTNILHFTVNADLGGWKYWWVGEDKPSIIVETTGITITSFVASSTSVSVAFTCDDPKATVFYLQTRTQGGAWVSVANVNRGDFMTITYNGFTIDKTRDWRIMSEYTEGE